MLHWFYVAFHETSKWLCWFLTAHKKYLTTQINLSDRRVEFWECWCREESAKITIYKEGA